MGNILKKPSVKAQKNGEKTDEAETVFFDCQLCSNHISPTRKFNNSKDCSHIFCTECIAKHIDSRIERNAAEITCPGTNCEMVLDPISCQPIIPDALYQRWSDLLCYSVIAGLPKCYCPNKNCMALIVNECGGSVTSSQCPKCKMLYCFHCRIPWHNGRQCDEIRREMLSLNDMLFMELTVGKEKLVSCPNCRMYVELVPALGFCIIRCRCRTRFCYHCGRKCEKLSCVCGGYRKEMEDYHKHIGFNIFGIILLLTMGLLAWLVYKFKNDSDNTW